MAVIGNTNTTQAFTPAVDYFSGNGSTTAFTLSRPVASVAQVQVVIDNVAQNPSSAYTISGSTITFTSAPLSGTNNIYVYYTSPITQVIAPGQGTVGLTQLSTTGTASTSTFLRGDNSWSVNSQEIGQCRLVLSSTTAIKLNPCDGQYIKIAGVFYSIPSAGVTLTNSGLSSSTLYYIYAYISGGNVTLSASTTGYTTDSTAGNIGTPILTGNNAYTLVGMVYMNSSTQFADDSGNRNVLSYFNRLDKFLKGSASNYTTTSTTQIIVSPAIVTGLNWSNDGICVWLTGQGGMTGSYSSIFAAFDNNTSNFFGADQIIYGPTGSLNPPVQVGGWHQPSEGFHSYYIAMGAVSGSGTATINNTRAVGYVRG